MQFCSNGAGAIPRMDKNAAIIYKFTLKTNEARCALYKEILDLFNEEIISRARSGKGL